MKRQSKEKAAAGPFWRQAPFGHEFFRAVLPDRIRTLCPEGDHRAPVVLLDLADGRTLDLCHIDLMTRDWMAVSVFRGRRSCAEMDSVFIPYDRIGLVTVSRRDTGRRSIGFQVGGPGPGVAAATPAACKSTSIRP